MCAVLQIYITGGHTNSIIGKIYCSIAVVIPHVMLYDHVRRREVSGGAKTQLGEKWEDYRGG